MAEIKFSLTEFQHLPESEQIDLSSICLLMLGNTKNQIKIDGKKIKSRDAFFNWQMANNFVFIRR